MSAFIIINAPIINLNPIDNSYTSNDKNYEIENFNQINIAESCDPIFINGTASGVDAYNWTWAESQPWCIGSGTIVDPYKIEDITIDCQGSGNGIEIQNSKNYYFIIRNCTVINAGSSSGNEAGIWLYNVCNGTIISNNCSFNHNIGIFANDCSNNNISANILTNNRIYGIRLLTCRNFTILDNYFSRSGISLEGVYWYSGLFNSHKINKNNFINGKSIYYFVNQFNLNSNNFTDAGQIILINCNHSVIENQDLTSGTTGILLYSCKNITVSDITILNNMMYGIKVFYSNYNNLSNIYLLNNTNGIELERSSNNLIKNNTISKCTNNGISIDGNSNFNNLTLNKLYNVKTGFYLWGDKNTIENNTLNFGDDGIHLYGDNNKIIGNNFTDFSESGIDTSNSDNNRIIGNILCRSSISLKTGKNNTLSYNKFNNSGLGFGFGEGDYYSNSIDTTNLVNNKPLYYYVNQSKLNSNNFTNAGQIVLINCNDSIISNQNISYTINGIFLRLSFNTTIFNNTISNCNLGIYLSNSSNSNLTINKLYNFITGFALSGNKNITIENNTLNLGNYGIRLSNSDNITILGNNLADFSVSGIYTYLSDKNKIIGNEIFNNDYGIYLKLSNNNILNRNNINYNNIGVFFESSNLTYVVDNILVDNTVCFYDDGNCYGNIFINNRCIKTQLDQEDDDSEKKEDNSILIVGLILGIGALALISGLSCYYLLKKPRYSKIKFFKRFKKVKASKEILAEFDKEELIELFQEGGPSDPYSPLREMNLTLISKVFLKKVDKLGLDINEKVEFLKEMLYFSSKEREDFVNDLFKRLKSGKQKKHIFNRGW